MWWTLTTNLNLNREDSMMGKILIDSEQEPRRRVHAYASESQIEDLNVEIEEKVPRTGMGSFGYVERRDLCWH